MNKILISIPNIGHTPVEAYSNRLVNMMSLGKLEALSEGKFEFVFIVMGRMFTPLAREEACKAAIEHNCTHILMIDDDMICPDDMFQKLFRHDLDLVAPLAFTRNPPYNPVIYSVKQGWDPISNKEYYINHWVKNYPKDSLVECDAVGFGAALFKTSILEKVPMPWFISTNATGEDILFCSKIKKYGFRVFMDTSVKLGHVSHPKVITEEFVEEYRKDDKLFEKRHRVYDYKYENLKLGAQS